MCELGKVAATFAFHGRNRTKNKVRNVKNYLVLICRLSDFLRNSFALEFHYQMTFSLYSNTIGRRQ